VSCSIHCLIVDLFIAIAFRYPSSSKTKVSKGKTRSPLFGTYPHRSRLLISVARKFSNLFRPAVGVLPISPLAVRRIPWMIYDTSCWAQYCARLIQATGRASSLGEEVEYLLRIPEASNSSRLPAYLAPHA